MLSVLLSSINSPHIYNYIDLHLNRHNSNDHSYIKKFQEAIQNALLKQGYNIQKEVPVSSGIRGDKIDLLCDDNGQSWIIEIDATRADQVAKKFVSRIGMLGIKNAVSYVAVLYPDTRNGKQECLKYILDMHEILKGVNKKSRLYAIFIDPSALSKHVTLVNYSTKRIPYSVNGMPATGMKDAANKAIDQLLRRTPITFALLQKDFAPYISLSPTSRAHKVATSTADGLTIYSIDSLYQTGIFANWQPFAAICKKHGIIIEEDW